MMRIIFLTFLLLVGCGQVTHQEALELSKKCIDIGLNPSVTEGLNGKYMINCESYGHD